MLVGKNIVLLVSGSIAAYKSAELVRELVKLRANVHVAMSRSATEFISPLTLQTLSNNPVRTELFDVGQEGEIGHIELADKADIVLLAPASANTIARAANGMADDLITSILLATKAKVIIAPAMNVNMWDNPLTQQNIRKLHQHGATIVEPDSGFLACGWTGDGRLAELSTIVEAVIKATKEQDLTGCDVVVTAGATQEYLDPIRFISNRSSGKMGYAIAKIAAQRGANVTLISGPTSLEAPAGVNTRYVTTAVEMHDEVLNTVLKPSDSGNKRQYVFMVAAVADHRPATCSKTKLKNDKSKNHEVSMVPNPDILKEIGDRREKIEKVSEKKLKLIGFAAETGDEEQLFSSAQNKLKNKNADVIVGNFASDSFGKDSTRVWLFDRSGTREEISTADKSYVADKIISWSIKS